jgi:NAD-dependent deacetylase
VGRIVKEAAFEAAALALARAKRVAVFSGAGISAESGVPTFRSTGGLWENHPIEEVATLEGFQRNPARVWEFYEARRRSVQEASPNPGHLAIARMESLFESLAVITQNVDGLHQRAGSRNVRELHGSLWIASCSGGCGCVVDPFEYPAPSLPPRCGCGSLLRPKVVWFGEMLPERVWFEAQEASSASDVVLLVGTSGAVWPAAGIPLAARRAGAFLIEVNPEETELSGSVDLVLRAPSGKILPQLAGAIELQKRSPRNLS